MIAMNFASNESLRRKLAFSGVIPFLVCSLFLVIGFKELPIVGSLNRALSSYTVLIFAFMAGVHWGQYLQGIKSRVNLMVESNVLAIACWFAFLLMPVEWFYAASTLGFICLLWTDYNLYREGKIAKHYLQTRASVTSLVVMSLIIAALYG